MAAPLNTYGAMRYSTPLLDGHVMSGLIDLFIPESQESQESVIPGRVYWTQYTAPGMPPLSGQPSQGGVAAPVEQPRQSSPTIVPFITVSERYDSNVLLTTKKVYDYVTSISPGARWNFQSAYMDGSVMGTMTAERYVRNPGLSYIGSSGALSAGFDNLFGRMVGGWSVRVIDSFSYTPQQPAFVAPEAGNQVSSAYVRGIQAYRSNSFSNVGSITSTLPITPDTSFATTYTNQILRFFNKVDPSTSGGALFNVDTHIISAGPQYRLSPLHTIGLTYQFQDMVFAPVAGGAPPGGITTHGGMLTWSGHLSSLFDFELGGGASVVLPSNSLQGTGQAMVRYTTPEMIASLTYSRGISPSFFLAGGALISDLLVASLTYNLTSKWFAIGGFNYSQSQSTEGLSLKFDSYGPTGSLNYRITPYVVASGSATYFQMTYVSSGVSTTFDRELFMLSIRAEWN